MTRLSHARKALALTILCVAPHASIAAQHEEHGSGPVDSTAVKFGSVSFANSGSAAAQPAFLRGLALLHNFDAQREQANRGKSPVCYCHEHECNHGSRGTI